MDLPTGLSRETKIRRDREGRWWNDGDPIEHPSLARAFDGWLRRAEDGRRILQNDINWAYVAIEGPDLFVTAAHRTSAALDAPIELVTRGERRFALDPRALTVASDGAFETVLEGLTARFDRHASHQLGSMVDEAGALVVDGVAHRLLPSD